MFTQFVIPKLGYIKKILIKSKFSFLQYLLQEAPIAKLLYILPRFLLCKLKFTHKRHDEVGRICQKIFTFFLPNFSIIGGIEYLISK